MAQRSLAAVQVEADLARLGRRPFLLERKWQRMARSPFSFLRGASALWTEALRRQPALLSGLPGRGWLVGDLHLENVGLFRTTKGIAFHVNDFDETFEGAVAFDVLRLLTSTLLARAELQSTGLGVLEIAYGILEGYDAGLRGAPARPPTFVRALTAAVGAEKPEAVLKKKVDDAGKLIRNKEKTPPAPVGVSKLVPRALEAWVTALPTAMRPKGGELEVLDVTRRIAGTGSLGVERLLVLVKGDAAPWLLEVKEVRGSSATSTSPSAEQLVNVVRTVLPRPPAYFGASKLGALPVIVGRLGAKEDKLGIDEIPAEALEGYARHLGHLVGEIHRRGGATARWTATVQARALDAAQQLAGVHETAFLQFCDAAYERGLRA